ncbi:nuclease-like protein/UvrD-like helicase family protein [Brevibacterium pityocampae]
MSSDAADQQAQGPTVHCDDQPEGAEKVVLDHLRAQLPDNAVIIHGQRLTTPDADVEIDFLILWPGIGIVVLEVKGGQVRVQDGRWSTSGSPLRRSPLEQAMAGKYAFLDWIRPRMSMRPGRTVHMACLPYTNTSRWDDLPDAPRTHIVGQQDLDGLAAAMSTVLRTSMQREDPPSPAAVALVVKQLWQTHAAIENARSAAIELEDRANRFTQEQEKLLSVLRYQTRAELSGGPGSGKTHLALIKARQLAADGQRVALMCYSRGLGRYFELMTAQWPQAERPAFIGLFHDLPLSWGAEHAGDDDPQFWEVELPTRMRALAAARDRAELFDAIVVDEGQDFSNLWWEAVLSCLRDPDAGVLYVFTDERQRIFDRDGDAPIEMNPFHLGENLRNAQTVAEAFGWLSDEPQIVRNPGGEPVEQIDVPFDQALEAADDAVERLLESGDWKPEDIALLTTYSRHPVQKETVETEGYDAYWDGFFSASQVFYGHVLGFKGLERAVVVFCINGFRDPARAREMLYVGMSRARSKLVLVGNMTKIQELTAVAEEP